MHMEVSYLLNVCFCTAFFYVLYSLVFRKTTFFTANRFYLLTGLVLSFIIPTLQLSVNVPDIHVMTSEYLSVSPPVNVDDPTAASSEAAGHYSLVTYLSVLYWIGFIWTGCSLVMGIVKILLLRRRSVIERREGASQIFMTASQPFSFFNWIFLPYDGMNEAILQHEYAHVRQRHWIDLLVIEIVQCILWFNPVLIFYKRAIRLQHEYLADAWTVSRGVTLPEYLHCLLRQVATSSGINIASYFNSGTIKKRINMMTRNQTSRKFSVLYLLTFPLIALLLFSFSGSTVPWDGPVAIRDNAQIVLVVDPGHGGSDDGILSSHGESEKEITLSIAKTLKTMAEEKGITVVLTRSDDRAMSLQERVDISRGVKPVAFISVHVNSGANPAQSGIECFVNNNAEHSANSLRLAKALTQNLQDLQGIKVNGIKDGNFFVLKGAENPGVILELGFLTNDADYNFIKEPSNQRAICDKIIAGVQQFAK